MSSLDGEGGSFFTLCCLVSSSDRDFDASLSLDAFSCFDVFSAFVFSATLFSVTVSLLKIRESDNLMKLMKIENLTEALSKPLKLSPLIGVMYGHLY